MELSVILGIIIVLGFAGCGIFLIYSGFKSSQGLNRGITWPAARGKVISSEIVESSGSTKGGGVFSIFKPVTRFKYMVGDVEFVSMHIGQAAEQINVAGIQQMKEQYPVGKIIEVRYDPQNPSNAFLATTTEITRKMIITGIVFITISILIGAIGSVIFLIYFFTH
jgi:hypothetical protein